MEKELEKKTLAGILKDAKVNWKEAGAWLFSQQIEESKVFGFFFYLQVVIIDITI